MFYFDYLKRSSNSLEQIALKKYPVLNKIKSYLNNLEKPIFVRMSGSGSAFIAYYASKKQCHSCLLYTSPSPRDATLSRMPSSA